MEIYDSLLMVVHDPDGQPTVLLDYGDPIELDGAEVGGSQQVNVSALLRAIGVNVFARGNEQHDISFTKVEPQNSTEEAVAVAMNHGISLPRHSAPLLIATESGWNWRIANAVLEEWPAEYSGIVVKRTYQIVGGRKTVTAQPSGGNQYTRPDGISTYLRPA